MESLFEYQSQLLLKEIEIIQLKISTFDDLSFKIKGWAITLWSAIIIWGYKNSNYDFLIVAIIVVFSFWLVDAYFKTYQKRFRLRIRTIEDFINSNDTYKDNNLKSSFDKRSFDEIMIFDPIGRLSKDYNDSYRRKYFIENNIWRAVFYWDVLIIYAVLFIVTVYLINKIQ